MQETAEVKVLQTLQDKHIKKTFACQGGKIFKSKKEGNVTTEKYAGTCLSQSNPCGNLAFGVIMQISTF